jgi:hypothetical protein
MKQNNSPPPPDEDHEIIDPQKRKIVYSYLELIRMSTEHEFTSEGPKHFNEILTKPDCIYIDRRTNLHLYQKIIGSRLYTVTALEMMRKGRKCFCINSWFVKKDTTLDIIHDFVAAGEDTELKEKLEAKIEKNKSWMKIVYMDNSVYEKKKFTKAGITLISDDESEILSVKKNMTES